jgi:hypothetical protein
VAGHPGVPTPPPAVLENVSSYAPVSQGPYTHHQYIPPDGYSGSLGGARVRLVLSLEDWLNSSDRAVVAGELPFRQLLVRDGYNQAVVDGERRDFVFPH